jgi:ribonuclease P protein component
MTRGGDIARVRARGIRVRGRVIELRVLENAAAAGRVGIVVPKHSHTAVARNTVKRRIREIIRDVWPLTKPGTEILVYALPSAYRASFDRLHDEIRSLWPVTGQPA